VTDYRRIIRPVAPVSLRHTVFSHGWINLAPFSYDARRNRLLKVERIGHSIVTVGVVRQENGDFKMTVYDASLCREEVLVLRQRVVRWLCLDWDPAPALEIADRLSKPIAAFIRAGGGRFLCGSSFYEDFVKTLTTVNASWSFTQKMVQRLVTDIGGGAFPLPAQILKTGVRNLEIRVKMGYRAKVLADATRFLLKEKMIDDEGNAKQGRIAFEDLIAVKGIGNYAAAHMCVLLQDFSKIPVDSEVTAFCTSCLGLEKKDIPAHFSSWKSFAFLGYKLSRIVADKNWIG
jgi:3-methyladenine DNA glycosylase/8-oxoguanine DNA glycosylase